MILHGSFPGKHPAEKHVRYEEVRLGYAGKQTALTNAKGSFGFND